MCGALPPWWTLQQHHITERPHGGRMHDPWDAPKQGPGPWRSFFELMGKKALSRNVLKGAVDGAHLQLTFISPDNTCRPHISWKGSAYKHWCRGAPRPPSIALKHRHLTWNSAHETLTMYMSRICMHAHAYACACQMHSEIHSQTLPEQIRRSP